jgi:hypothetical protein
MTRPVYFDYNGTLHAPEVIAAMRPFLESKFGNPSSDDTPRLHFISFFSHSG